MDDIVFEQDAAMAVQREVGGDDTQFRNNFKFLGENRDEIAEFGGIVVHKSGENVVNSTAYVIECSYSPQIGEVAKLQEKVELFKRLAHGHKYFGTVTKFVPVLGGHRGVKRR